MQKNPVPLIIAGIVILAICPLAYKKPELFLRGRRSRLWVNSIGEERTKKVVRYFSVPLMVVIALFLFAMAGGWLE